MSPAWLFDVVPALMLVVAAISATRLATALSPARRLSAAEPVGSRPPARGPGGADMDIAHLLMSIAMAGMLGTSVRTLPAPAWEVIFGLLTAWFAWRVVGDTKINGPRSPVIGHRAALMFHCAAMVYMFAALMPAEGMDMTGMSGGMAQSLKYPELALSFAFVLVCYSVLDLFGELSARRDSRGVAPSAGAAPATYTAPTAAAAVACRIAMGMAMALMLLSMS